MKTLFQNARVVDGTGNPAFFADVLVEDDRIAKIFRKADGLTEAGAPTVGAASGDGATRTGASSANDPEYAGTADRPDLSDVSNVVDVRGKVLAPGFIDAHSHNDWFCLMGEGKERYFDTFIQQGITSMITGNCGFSATGFNEDSPYLDDLGGELFHIDGGTGSEYFHGSPKGWLDAVDGHCPVNTAILLGHGTARLAAAGMETVDLSPRQEADMLAILEEGLREGAAGISLGLMYKPGIAAKTEELEKVAALCAKYDRILTVHPRAESAISMSYSLFSHRSHLLLAIDELDHLVRRTGCRLEHSHLIFVGRKTWKDVDDALGILEKLERDGYKVGFDMYPKHYGASVITVVLPDWYQTMDPEKRKSAWVNLKLRAMIGVTPRLLGFGFDDILLAYPGEKHPDYTGRYISEIAKTEGRKEFDVYLQVCEDSDFKARVLMGSYQNDEIVDRLMRHPQSVYMTDAWYEQFGVQNGAIYGAFPMFFRLAREKNIPLEETVHKMTGKTAERFQLKDRGLIREGGHADLVIFDADHVSEGKEESDPPVGIEQVYINGVNVFDAKEGLKPERAGAGQAMFVG